ncbi:hypothetical protein D3C83_185840 [compost metagenome]
MAALLTDRGAHDDEIVPARLGLAEDRGVRPSFRDGNLEWVRFEMRLAVELDCATKTLPIRHLVAGSG